MQNILNSEKTKKVIDYVKEHKIKSAIIFIILIIIIYFVYAHFTANGGQTTYLLGTAQNDTIVTSLTETGQVEANHQLILKPNISQSSSVVYVAKNPGDTVNAGDLIVELDTTNAEKTVRDAEASLQNAEISLQKIQEPADQVSLLQAQDSVTTASSSLKKAYDNGFSAVAGAFVDLPSVLNGLDAVLHNSDVNTSTNQQRNIDFYQNAAASLEGTANFGKAQSYATNAENAFQTAKLAYTQNALDYKNANRTEDPKSTDALVSETYQTTVAVADAVKSASNLIQYYQDLVTSENNIPIAKSTTELNILSGYTGTINNDVTNLSNSQSTIQSDEINLPEQIAALNKLQTGADPLDIQSAQLAVTQQQNALQDAKDNLSYYYIRAPFSGTVPEIDVKVGDPVDSGTTIGTLVASEQVADITLNEVDAAKVQIGDKATITFDAIDGLTLTGKISSIDTLGTVSQGVVNYTATITFDSMDSRVKSGMSLSASIITATKADVLTVPSSAIKSSSGGSYVLVFNPALTDNSDGTQPVASNQTPIPVYIQTGLSDDTNTEITSGLTNGEQIVIKTILPTTTSSQTTGAPSILSTAGGNRGGGTTGGALRGVSGTGR